MRFQLLSKTSKGFSLIEITLVLGVIGFLAGVIIVAVRPSQYFAKARNVQRRADLERIQGAMNQYSIERDGSLPPGVSSTLQMIGTAGSGCNVSCGGSSTSPSCTNLGAVLSPTYVDAMPIDPTTGSAAKTYYAVQKLVYGTSTPSGLLIRACSTENSSTSVEIKQ